MGHETAELAGDLKATANEQGWAWHSPVPTTHANALAHAIGPIIKPSIQHQGRKTLRPFKKTEAPLNSMSAVVGTASQPFHTDCAYLPVPPRYVMLTCISLGEADCCTHVWAVDWRRLLPAPPIVLTHPGWIVRGGGLRRPFYSQILNQLGDHRSFIRFDPCCMTPPHFCNLAVSEVSAALESHVYAKTFSWKVGSVLLIDNWRCLHGRGPGADRAPSRRLERWYIGERDGMVDANSL